MATAIPLVDYLIIDDQPHLRAHQCVGCGARYFDRRNACASCAGREFERVDIPTDGELQTFTIVAHAAPGVPVPFVAGVVDCGGTCVRANLVNVPPDPAHVHTGMKVRLCTQVIGVDSSGNEAVSFGFEPLDEPIEGN
jgi:uncharacterized OB-fold protein